MKAVQFVFLTVCLAAWPLLGENAQTNAPSKTIPEWRLEQVRSACIEGRRRICGRVLQITPAGLVVDSGYTNLLSRPFDNIWVTRGTVVVPRAEGLVEARAPDSVAVGLVLVTDLPRRPKPSQYDYVHLVAYPAGYGDYVPVSGVKKKIRRFAGGVEKAVNLSLQAESDQH